MKQIKATIVTQTKKIAEHTCYMVVLPGEDGYFGVLHGHQNMISTLIGGVVQFFDENKKIIHEYIIEKNYSPEDNNVTIDDSNTNENTNGNNSAYDNVSQINLNNISNNTLSNNSNNVQFNPEDKNLNSNIQGITNIDGENCIIFIVSNIRKKSLQNL